MEHASSIECRDLTVAVADRSLVSDLELQVSRGEFLAVLGQNGSGKSLTLHTLAGLRDASSGIVCLNGRDLRKVPRQQIARELALLPQHTEDVFPATVLETVLIGRHPHIGRFQWESRHDHDLALESLQHMDLGGLANRDVTTLSGGERRRLAIAQVLTQAPDVYLLDEPTNHLDPQHQLDVVEKFRAMADQGNTVVASLHDVNLAARYADKCLLLFGDGRWMIGSTDEVLNGETLTELFATTMNPIRWQQYQLYIPGRPN